jgi:chromosome segregation ATPase
MDNGEYVNQYIDILTNTMTDAVVRNISLQAQLNINEKVVIESQNAVKELKEQVNKLTSELQEVNNMREEYESVKHQVQHVDTFRKELLKARKETDDVRKEYQNTIDELTDKIEYLQLTPAKRKKLDEKNTTVTPVEESSQLPIADLVTKDGGNF